MLVGPLHNGAQSSENKNEDSNLTDEQLARKLQAEWDKESKGASRDQEPVSEEESASKSLAFPERRPTVGNEGAVEDGDAYMDTSTKGEISESNKELQGFNLDMLQEADKKASRLIAEQNPPSTLSLQSAGSAEDNITSNIPFDDSPFIFEPSKYVAALQGHWAAEGGNASYALLTRCFVLVNSTQSRIKIVDTLVNLLRVIIEGDPSSLLPTVRTTLCSAEHMKPLSYIIYSSSYPTVFIPTTIPPQTLHVVNILYRFGSQRTLFLLHISPSSLD